MKFDSPHGIVFHPFVTEKTTDHMTKRNTLEFRVRPEASKPQIREAVEELFGQQVLRVRTRMTKEGKRALVTFEEKGAAEEVGMSIGVF